MEISLPESVANAIRRVNHRRRRLARFQRSPLTTEDTEDTENGFEDMTGFAFRVFGVFRG
jgi:hypothetical protein